MLDQSASDTSNVEAMLKDAERLSSSSNGDETFQETTRRVVSLSMA